MCHSVKLILGKERYTGMHEEQLSALFCRFKTTIDTSIIVLMRTTLEKGSVTLFFL